MHIDTKIKMGTLADFADIKSLYQAVASIEGGIARCFDEITDDYVHHFITMSMNRGFCLVAISNGRIVGEIHAYRPVPRVFSHVLSDLTIAVHPEHQAFGIGRMLFRTLLDEVALHHPDILRVELMTRESNQRAILFYESLGFLREGRMIGRVKSSTGELEADLPMAWGRQ